jgi:DNA-binding NarL/FixJ family response regulator
MASFNEVDVSELARQVTCPTLVLHSRGDARIPFEEGRRVASAIRAAEFVPLDSRNHILLDHQSAWMQCFDEIDAFMRRHGGQAQRSSLGAAGLTPTEERVLHVVAAGLNNAQIAAELGISPKTVRNHINHIFNKLGMSDRSRVIVLARDAGFGQSQ